MPRGVFVMETRPNRRGPTQVGGYIYPADVVQVRTLVGPDGRLVRELQWVGPDGQPKPPRAYLGRLELTSNTDAS